MVLGTTDGLCPSSRTLVLKAFDQRGFVFFTNYCSRLGASVSQQSSAIRSRAILEQQWEELTRRFAGTEVPLPVGWGGFRVQPQETEFWQGREHRLHDRFR
ncbi:hypothetical protein KBY65_11160 [Cyanobium sp. Alchichica 3B3-8F6]|nr:hypothetical protein [Cyanobium sp. Alchichica 3B3-8F6]